MHCRSLYYRIAVCLLGSILFGAGAQAQSALVINEIHYRAEETTHEFVEFVNRSDELIDISEYQISDDRMNPVPILDDRRMVKPGEFVVLVRDGADFEQAFPGVAYIEPQSWPILRQTGDSSVLYHNESVVDSVGYTPSWGGYDRDTSLERIDPEGPSDHPSNFSSSDGPPTPGSENSIYQPNTSPPVPIYAAAYDATVDLYFDEPINEATVVPASFQLNSGRQPVTSTLRDNRTRILLAFDREVSSNGIKIIGLADLAGNVVSSETVDLAFAPSPIHDDRPGELVINEIMYQPKLDEYDSEPDQVEYIELFNRGERTIDLGGLYRTDRANQHGEADSTFFESELTSLDPGNFAIIKARRDGVDLRKAFPESAMVFDHSAVIEHSSVTLSLRASGDVIKLHRRDGVVVDSVVYDQSWHRQQLQETRGISLERILPDGRSNDPANWTSSLHPDGGTPLLKNAVHLATKAPDETRGIQISPQTFTPGGGGPRPHAAISYRLDSDDAMVRVRIFDTMGRLIRELEGARPAGRFEDQLLWDGRNDDGHLVRLGVYIVHLEATLYDAGTVEQHRAPVVVADPF